MQNKELTAVETISAMTTAAIIEAFELTNGRQKEDGLPMVRGWLMYELEARNHNAFDAWMDCSDASIAHMPSRFF